MEILTINLANGKRKVHVAVEGETDGERPQDTQAPPLHVETPKAHPLPLKCPLKVLPPHGERPEEGSTAGECPLNINLFNKLLEGFSKREYVISGLQHGFRIKFLGKECDIRSSNSKSANENPEEVDKKLTEEINLGRVAGPFDEPPFKDFKCCPLSLREKSTPGKFRLLHNLSYPYDETSVNGGIPQENKTVSYASIQTAVKVINTLGPDCNMAKADIESAYRLIPVHRDSYHLLGFKWRGKYYYDKFLPMGMAESCAIFETISDAICFVMNRHGVVNIVKILDDFLVLNNSKTATDKDLNVFKYLATQLNIPLVSEKTSEEASTCLTFLGVQLDTKNMTAALPPEKLERYGSDIDVLLGNGLTTDGARPQTNRPSDHPDGERPRGRRPVSVRTIQQIVGKLQFATSVIPVGKPFLRRLIDMTLGKQPGDKVWLSRGAQKDLQVWREFLQKYNGVSIIREPVPCHSHEINLYTDASDLAYAAVYGSQWFQGEWNRSWKAKNIAVRELYPILLLTELFHGKWQNQHIIFWCDNQAIVTIINKQTSKNKEIMTLLRPLVLLLMLNNIKFVCKYIHTASNTVADAISRLQVPDSLRQTYGLRPYPEQVPDGIRPSDYLK